MFNTTNLQTDHPPMSSKIARKSHRVAKRALSERRNVRQALSPLSRITSFTGFFSAPAPTLADDSSASEYGVASKKRRRRVQPTPDDLRVSTRGVRVPNYAEDAVYDSELDEDPEFQAQANMTAEAGEEQDEIECVLGHSRHEDRSKIPLFPVSATVLKLHLESSRGRSGGCSD